MLISGLQKTTLIDYPGKIACTIFLFGCNFKCGFCHNPELVLKNTNPEIDEKEILKFLEKRKGKLEGVCVTGGEPLLSLEKEFLKKIKSLGYKIKLDTNGSFPNKLKDLIEEKLIDYIAMDIKSSKENYSKTTASKINIKKIEESIKLIHSSGLDYEFRTTIVPGIHDEEEEIKIAEWLNQILKEKPKKYFLQGFKNSGKFIDKKYTNCENISSEYLKVLKEKISPYFIEAHTRY